MIADSVGLGKTWIGKKLLEDFAYHLRQKAVVVCPASLREMWEGELRDATISASVLSQEELGREDFDPSLWGDADVLLIDESHNFRNQTAQRYSAIDSILGAHGGRGRDHERSQCETEWRHGGAPRKRAQSLPSVCHGEERRGATCAVCRIRGVPPRGRRAGAR